MHPIQQQFCEHIKSLYPDHFKNKKVLDVGSLDINGNNKYLFDKCDYIGLDIVEGKNVDVVSIAHLYDCPDESFDTIVSTNAFEHDMHFDLTLQKIVSLLKPGGLLFFSAANSWKEHGTKRTSPSQSATSKMGDGWSNYYKNVTISDIEKAIDCRSIFSEYSIGINHKDITFFGVKK